MVLAVLTSINAKQVSYFTLLSPKGRTFTKGTSMLPMLKRNKEASASGPIESVERKPDQEPEFDSMEAAAQDLCDAIHSKDMKAIAAALRAAFELMESQPHEEGEHV
jgi:hypothetical protein